MHERNTISRAGWIGILALAAVLLAVPHLVSFSQQELLVFLTINVLLVVSYRLLTLTGEWSLAHVVMMGVGAYGSALYSKLFGFPVPLAMIAGAATAGLIATVLSFPLFRMKGFYFLIGSFAAGEVIRLIWKRFTDPFGGPKGIQRIPAFPEIDLGFLRIDFYQPENYYYLVLVVVLASLWVLYRIERSRIGLTFHAIHWQDKLSESVGIDTFRHRMLAFVIASFFAGVAGALYAHYLSTVNPNQFNVDTMVYVLIWTIVGGTTRWYGPILGVIALTIIDEVVLRGIGADQLRPLLYGAILICAILFLPDGLESLVIRASKALRSRSAPAVTGAAGTVRD
ncbi:branched-chain amino acid transport system permease protein [Mesorhizobium soli]|uniref:branched-chain amino acid ABC transporter permease n=1 Tax=Pseudaminobacter soli (ex Li et al. 2025) TaxID=1295366 RepID=UPI0024764894|nr:branched-chain amino acid ABC transporter permease [Mesorhizobium soli]MDH6233939.1 branched-chain amino acid transport system permease protein [Mesorhizobium soli]